MDEIAHTRISDTVKKVLYAQFTQNLGTETVVIHGILRRFAK